jgi:hypothetical protein
VSDRQRGEYTVDSGITTWHTADEKKIIETMNKIIQKIIYTSLAIVGVIFAMHGMVTAQPACCVKIESTCIPISIRNRVNSAIHNACRPSPSHHYRSDSVLKNNGNGLGAEAACCKADYCQTSGQSIFIGTSFSDDVYRLAEAACFEDVRNCTITTTASINLQTIQASSPIYILIKSILC